MSQTEIIEALRHMTAADRLAIAEAVLQMLRVDLQVVSTPNDTEQMRAAAITMLADYQHDNELTIFTALDSEDFHADG